MEFNLYFKSRQGEMINMLKELVRRESPSHDKKAVDACTSFIVQEFKKIGSKTTRFAQKDIGDLYLVEYPRREARTKKDKILLLTHCDTVWPLGKLVKMPFYVTGNKVYGPGVLDMKAGIVMALFSLKALNELSLQPSKKIALFINSAEEIGSKISHDIISKLARMSTYVLCLEPAMPGGGLKTERKGRVVIRLEVKGKSAHAGTPEKGINAIDELTGHLQRLKKLARGGVTVSTGMIGGGEKANIVAENAWAVLDIRFWKTVQKERITGHLRELEPMRPGAKIKFSVESLTPPMEKTHQSAKLVSLVKKIASSLHQELEEGRTGGGSDASIASSLGIPTVDGLGPDGEGIHAENEHLLIPSFIQRTALLTELLLRL